MTKITSRNICLIGYGYWGKNLLRNLMGHSFPGEICIAEIQEGKRNQIQAQYPNLKVYATLEDVLANEKIDAVVIATVTGTHYELAKQALQNGKHVLVEKPMTTSVVHAQELNALAAKNNLTLMVDHVFLYHPVVKKMKQYFNENFLGNINYIDTTRINLGIYQKDINVLWDLACHDISIVNYLVTEKPNSVRAIGRINPEHGVEDIAYMFLYYPSGLLVQINSSWASPVKMRKMIIGGDKRMLIYDDIEPTNKLTIYEYEQSTQMDENKTKLADYRLGNVIIPKYETTEALQNVINEFNACIQSGTQPLSNGENAIAVINILEKAQQSLSLSGAIIELS